MQTVPRRGHGPLIGVLVGVGEGGAGDTMEQCAGLLIGEDPFRTDRLWQSMYRSYFYPAGREKAHALGALDVALWDLKGKALGVPVYQLLGGYVDCNDAELEKFFIALESPVRNPGNLSWVLAILRLARAQGRLHDHPEPRGTRPDAAGEGAAHSLARPTLQRYRGRAVGCVARRLRRR